MNTCSQCNREFEYSRNKGGTKSKCNSCHVADRRKAIKVLLVLEAGGKCIICGYDRCIRALEFHHLDSSTKEFNLAGNKTIGLAKMRKEAEKCVLLCANHHREVEEGLIDLPRTCIPSL